MFDDELLINEWRAHRATVALQEYWKRTVPAGTDFDRPDAVNMVLVMLDCYETALRRIAEKGGPQADMAKEALSYKQPVWR